MPGDDKQDGESIINNETSKGKSIEKQSAVSLQPTRCSARIPKRPRREASPPPSPPKKSNPTNTAKEPKRQKNLIKRRRSWELWSVEDKHLFFNALKEYGKDFEAIEKLLFSRYRNKSKDQIRFFYYRTWNKISKYIENTNDVNQKTLELFGLINYGELRKRCQIKISEKFGMKLNELVHTGTTVIKLKGKSYRVKTPMCKTLRRLSCINEAPVVKQRFPENVYVELWPKTNAAWYFVQSMAQNPRIRMKVNTDRQLSSIIEFLEKKWTPPRVRLKEKRLSEKEKPTEELHLYLVSDNLQNNYFLHHLKEENKITLDNCKDNVSKQPSTPKIVKKTKDPVKSKSKKLLLADDVSSTSCDEMTDKSDDRSNAALNSSVNSLFDDNLTNTLNSSDDATPNNDTSDSGSEDKNKKVNVSLSNGNSASLPMPTKSTTKVPVKKIAPDKKIEAKVSLPNKTVPVKDVSISLDFTSGWTRRTAQSISLLWLLPHYDDIEKIDKILFEYEWTPIVPDPIVKGGSKVNASVQNPDPSTSAAATESGTVQQKTNSNSTLNASSNGLSISTTPCVGPLNSSQSNMLRRLIDLTSTEFTDKSRHVKMSKNDKIAPCEYCSCGGVRQGSPSQKGTASSMGRKPRKVIKTEPLIIKSLPGSAIEKSMVVSTSMPLTDNNNTLTDKKVKDPVFRIPQVPKPLPVRQPQVLNEERQMLIERLIPRRGRQRMKRPMMVQRSILPKNALQARQFMAVAMVKGNPRQVEPVVQQLPGNVAASPVHVHPNQIIRSMPTRVYTPLTLDMPQDNAASQLQTTVLSPAQSTTNGTVTQSAPGVAVALSTMSEMLDTNTTTLPQTVEGGEGEMIYTNSPQATQGILSDKTDLTVPSITNGTISNSSTGTSSTALESSSTAGALSESFTFPLGSDAIIQPDSSTSFSSLLDFSLPSADNTCGMQSTDFSGLLNESSVSKVTNEDSLDLSCLSPSKMPKLHNMEAGGTNAESQLFNQELSIRQFLSESPLKRSSDNSNVSGFPSAMFSESSRDSIMGRLDVDVSLQHLMNESSMDYMAKFADLAAEISETSDADVNKKEQPPLL